MENTLEELIDISIRLGSDPSLVLGSFGNTSIKTPGGRSMFIKASGTCLKDMTTDYGWRKLNTQKVADILSDNFLENIDPDEYDTKIAAALIDACCDDKPASVKPSIESFFHAILDRCVIHLHPEAVLSIACAQNGQKHIAELFSHQKHPPLWVPYVGLGYASAKEMQRHIQAYEKQYGGPPKVLVIQNHGLVISDCSPQAAMGRTEETMHVFQQALPKLKTEHIEAKLPEADRIAHDIAAAVSRATGIQINTGHYLDAAIAAFMELPHVEQLCRGDALTNDEAAFTHGPPLWLEDTHPQAITEAMKSRNAIPRAFLVKNTGLFIAAPTEDLDLLADISRVYMQIRAVANQHGGLRPIPRNLLVKYSETSA